MQRNVEGILDEILNMPIESRKILIDRRNKMVINHSTIQTPIIEYRKEIQEKVRFACPHCGGDNIVGHNLKIL